MQSTTSRRPASVRTYVRTYTVVHVLCMHAACDMHARLSHEVDVHAVHEQNMELFCYILTTAMS